MGLDIVFGKTRANIQQSLRLRMALLTSTLCGTVIISAWVLSMIGTTPLVDSRWSRLMLLEAETKVRLEQDPAGWHAMHADGRECFVEVKETLPICLLLTGDDCVEFCSVNWPADLTLDQLPLAGFRAGQTQRPPMGSPGESLRADWGPRRPSILFETMIEGEPWRMVIAGFEHRIFVLGYAHEELFREPAYIERVIMVVAFVSLFVLAIIGWLIANQAVKPIKRIVETTNRISGSALDARIDADAGNSEFNELIEMINAMLARLEKSFSHSLRFTADASHELKTPLTVLYGRLNRGLQNAESEADQQLFAGLLGEVERLTAIVEKLLLLSRADSGEMKLQLGIIDLSDMVALLCEDIDLMDETVVVQSNIRRGIGIEGDYGLLQQVLYNLASNAVKYSVGERVVTIDLRQEGHRIFVEISNPSEPISDEKRNKVFDRFYQFDPSHNRDTAGAGLGLSLAREIILAHKGDIELDTSREGYAIFRMWFPSL
jgi:two-component system heavy metal sensor histidine kinase CusS